MGLIICQNLKSHREKDGRTTLNQDLKIFLKGRLLVFGCSGQQNALSIFPAGKVPGSRWRICQYSDIVQLLQRSTAGGRRGLIGEEITRFRELFVSTARAPRLASPPNLWRQFFVGNVDRLCRSSSLDRQNKMEGRWRIVSGSHCPSYVRSGSVWPVP